MSDTDPTPTQAIIVRPTVLPSIAQFGIERDLAIRLASARGFLPDHYFTGDGRERAAKVLAAIEYGRAVGIEPMIALQNITMIKGKAGASALLIGAQLRRAGYDIGTAWFDKQGAEVPKKSSEVWGCEITLVKGGKKTGDGAFSLTDAQRAGLIKDDSGWSKYPKDMLYARALTQAAREGAQDAVLGMAYTGEELGVEVDYDGQTETINAPGLDPWATAVEGEVVQEAVQPNTGVQAAPSPAASGVPEATGSLPVAAIQPASPAPSEGVQAKETPSQKETTEPVPPPAVAPAPRRAGRSVGPAPKRTNVVEVPQGAEKPATAPEVPVPATVNAEVVTSQPAPPALTEDPVLPEPPAAPVDEGEQLYLSQQRAILREAAATLKRLNVITKNHLVHALQSEPLEPVPPAEPNAVSDADLAQLIERDYPGRSIENLGVAELQNRLELITPFISKREALLKEKGITER